MFEKSNSVTAEGWSVFLLGLKIFFCLLAMSTFHYVVG